MLRLRSVWVLFACASCFAESGTVNDDGGTQSSDATSSGSTSSDTTESGGSTSSTDPDDGSGTSSTSTGTSTSTSDSTGDTTFCDAFPNALLCEDFDLDPLRPNWILTADNGGLVERTPNAALSSPPNGLQSVLSGSSGSTATVHRQVTQDWSQALDIELEVRIDEACPLDDGRLLAVDYLGSGGVAYRIEINATIDQTLEIAERGFETQGQVTQLNTTQALTIGEVGALRVIVQPGNAVSVELDGMGPQNLAMMYFPGTVPQDDRINVVLGMTTGSPAGPCRTSTDNLVVSPFE